MDKIWGDYDKQKADAVKDINKEITDCGSMCRLMPIFKIGMMYRF
jgi:hypothetical protein